jgi:hypothetical protein
VAHTHSWWDKLRLWFMPTGWRPTDLIGPNDLAAERCSATPWQEQQKVPQRPLPGHDRDTSSSQVVLGLAYMYLTINMALAALSPVDRDRPLGRPVLAMITSWGGILLQRPVLGARLGDLPPALHGRHRGVRPCTAPASLRWTGWHHQLWRPPWPQGLSMLYASYHIRRATAQRVASRSSRRSSTSRFTTSTASFTHFVSPNAGTTSGAT